MVGKHVRDTEAVPQDFGSFGRGCGWGRLAVTSRARGRTFVRVADDNPPTAPVTFPVVLSVGTSRIPDQSITFRHRNNNRSSHVFGLG